MGKIALTGAWSGWLLLECECPLPVILHADHSPALLLRLAVQEVGESAHLSVGQPLRRSVGILAHCIIVQHNHRQPCSDAGFSVLQHLSIADGIAECSV